MRLPAVPQLMRAMVLEHCAPLSSARAPLVPRELPVPVPRSGEVLIKVRACGVCHTELDIIEGRTRPAELPLIPGHQVVGTIAALGAETAGWAIGERVGVAWIFSACGRCEFCRDGRENLCADFIATGRDAPGGYAEFMTARAAFVQRIPAVFHDVAAAPLLCAGAVGYRALRLSNIANGQRLGFMGFGASAHLVLQLVRKRFPATRLYVFARNQQECNFARELGACWAGDIGENAPEKLHAIIDTTPAWLPVIGALQNLERGGRLVINAIRKEHDDKPELLRLDYASHLWQEKQIMTVANVTRTDVGDFLKLAAEIPLRPEVQTYALEDANRALGELKAKYVRGAKVLVI
jgi:propanol-preferring alcohol dehydrogenase